MNGPPSPKPHPEFSLPCSIASSPPTRHSTAPNMIQRSILRSSRAAVNSSFQPRSSFIPFRQRPTHLTARVPQSPRIASRWYSDTAEAAKEDADASKGESVAQGKAAETKPSEAEELRQQLEKREREVIDLKVYHYLTPRLLFKN